VSSAAVINVESSDNFGGGGGLHELEWEKNYNSTFTNLEMKFSFSFNNECRQQSNLDSSLQKCWLTSVSVTLSI